jgi:hypothetical protein
VVGAYDRGQSPCEENLFADVSCFVVGDGSRAFVSQHITAVLIRNSIYLGCTFSGVGMGMGRNQGWCPYLR